MFQDGHLEDAAHDAMAEHALVTCDLYSEPEHKWYGITAAPDAAGGIFVRLSDIPGREDCEERGKPDRAAITTSGNRRQPSGVCLSILHVADTGKLRLCSAASTVRAIDLRYLERWAASRRKPVLAQMGVDEIHLGKKQKFITVVSNLDSAEAVWFGRERKKETLDGFFQGELNARQRMRITAACVDMWEPYRLSIEQWAPNCRIVYDKFHVMQHANQAIDEVRRAEFFRKGGAMRGLVKGKRWLLLSRWMNLSSSKRQELTQLFAMNRKIFKAYLLKESLERLWTYRYEGAMVNYLHRWIDQLRWQRLKPFQKLAEMLVSHLDGILNYCRTKVPLGVVEAINGNIKSLLRRGRGYKNLRYLLLKAQRIAATRTEFVAFKKAA